MATVEVSKEMRAFVPASPPAEAPVAVRPVVAGRAARYTWAIARLSLGWVFLWAFLDKTFGLGFATESGKGWIDGGSPTEGFLTFGAKGPLKGFYNDLAGSTVMDWLFMIGLVGIGLALMLGIGIRIAAITGSVLMLMMFSALLQPENNPFVDDHVVYAVVLVGLALVSAGDTLGFGKWWGSRALVRRFPILK